MPEDQIKNDEGNKDRNPIDPRLKELLSDKARLSEEVVAKERLAEEKDKKIQELERENTFNSGFADMVGTYSAAKDHRDEIKAKVLSGYSVEDATLAVLGKAGKLGGSMQPITQAAGGSAATVITSGAEKKPEEMSLEEKRAALSKELIWS